MFVVVSDRSREPVTINTDRDNNKRASERVDKNNGRTIGLMPIRPIVRLPLFVSLVFVYWRQQVGPCQ